MNRFIATLLLSLPICCIADQVVPIDKVENNINIRLSPDATSDIVGKLDQGASIELVNTVDGWYEVKLEGGATGFVSSDWSRVVTDEEVAAEVAEEVVEAVAEEVTEEVVEEVAEEVVEEVVEEMADEVAEEIVAAVEPVVEDAVVTATAEEEPAAEPVVEVEASPEPEPAPPPTPVLVAEPLAEIKGTRDFRLF